MTNKGGFRPEARLATHHDEILIEALVAQDSESLDVMRASFREIARLARRCAELLQTMAGPNTGSRVALAGA